MTAETATGAGDRPGLAARGSTWWRKMSARPVVAHLIRAGERFVARFGNQFVAAVAYFSFLSMVPILMVAFSIAGYVLASQPALLDSLQDQVTAVMPGNLAAPIGELIDQAVGQRLAIGIVGLVVAGFAGVKWMGHLRVSVRALWRPVWRRTKAHQENVLLATVRELGLLVGLGLAVLISVLLTATAAFAQTLVTRWFGLQEQPWLTPVLSVVPIVVAIGANMLIFLWVYRMLPFKEFRARRKPLLLGSLIAAVGFEILKAALALLVTSTGTSATGAVFGSVIGLLVFFNAVARLFLMVAAWIATADDPPEGERGTGGMAEPAEQSERGRAPVPPTARKPALVTATMVAPGVAADARPPAGRAPAPATARKPAAASTPTSIAPVPPGISAVGRSAGLIGVGLAAGWLLTRRGRRRSTGVGES